LGVKIGLDEHTASARISRYESGVHEPPLRTAKAIANALQVPLAYLYCDDDQLAEIIRVASQLPTDDQSRLVDFLKDRLEQLGVSAVGAPNL
jgi:transcriptional regulator with XRE-family HTH domain